MQNRYYALRTPAPWTTKWPETSSETRADWQPRVLLASPTCLLCLTSACDKKQRNPAAIITGMSWYSNQNLPVLVHAVKTHRGHSQNGHSQNADSIESRVLIENRNQQPQDTRLQCPAGQKLNLEYFSRRGRMGAGLSPKCGHCCVVPEPLYRCLVPLVMGSQPGPARAGPQPSLGSPRKGLG